MNIPLQITGKLTRNIIIASILFFGVLPQAWAQTETERLTSTILQKDSLFWAAYNKCDMVTFQQFFAKDVEFYHDKGGITLGQEGITSNMKKNLCSSDSFRLRREAVEGSIKVFPMQSSGVIYGAIISGEHVFYVLEKGKEERLDGLAKFTHLWLLKDGDWKMTRILSYDHGPAPYSNNLKAIKLSPEVLGQFAGTYNGPETGNIVIKSDQNNLVLQINDNQINLYPKAENLFFTKERDLTFEFIRNDKGKVSKMIVREKGEIAEEAKLVQ